MPLMFQKNISCIFTENINNTHYKTNFSIRLLINSISAISSPQILSVKDEYIFLFLNFLITDLCNSSANSLFEMFSFLTLLPENLFAHVAEVFYQKIYKPLKQDHFDIHHS